VQSVIVEYDKDITRNIDELKNLLMKKQDGSYIPLKDIANIEIGKGPLEVQRINQQASVQFTVKYAADVNLGEISNLVDQKIADLNLPAETEIHFSGDRELLEDSINDMVLAFLLAI